MGILDKLFGKKPAVAKSTLPRELNLTHGQLDALKRSGAKVTEVIEVHVLDPNGNYVTTWEIGKDISADLVKKAKDSHSGHLYAVTNYEDGKPTTHVCTKDYWLNVKSHFDSIEEEAAASSNSHDDVVYVDERLANREYVLMGGNGSSRINAALFTAILLTFRNTGWRGAQCLFESPTNKMKWLSGSYSIDAKDAGDIVAYLNQLAIREPSFAAAAQPLLRVSSLGAFTIIT